MKDLQLIFIVDDMRDGSGMSVFWCNSCLSGLAPNRAPLPPAGRRVLRGSEEVPNFRLVAGPAADEAFGGTVTANWRQEHDEAAFKD
ncbi:hypothetical protein ABT026_16975 [Streptomyces sp. NPDC002734]|uniref:hypothetical protein n=1 Tax=Streptomyces sp. NPDC002734 TaxID=3154426 RepID=UPI0033212E48